ncbi:hypothetical protein [Salibacterium lacus]|uniref:DNA polymerase III beta sliding clamp central domain-containing protein n=1 Tax=Salibacterium lacus TaxID=1898109 RepID=A0ABW5T0J6_9BACI
MSGISYANFMKHAEKVTKSAGNTRPILQAAYHSEEGYVAVTDSHRLYIAENVYEGGEKAENPKTGDLVDGKYPDVTRIIPGEQSAQGMVEIKEVKGVAKAVKIIQQAATAPPHLSEKFTPKSKALARIFSHENNVYVATEKSCGIEAKLFIGKTNKSLDEDFNIYVNAEYLAQSFDVFKDAGIPAVTFRSHGNLSPFVIKGENVAIVISPSKNGDEEAE